MEPDKPPVLLHGLLQLLATSFENIAVLNSPRHRQGLPSSCRRIGHTGDIIDRPPSLEGMADDTAAAIKQLGIEPADPHGPSSMRNPGVSGKPR